MGKNWKTDSLCILATILWTPRKTIHSFSYNAACVLRLGDIYFLYPTTKWACKTWPIIAKWEQRKVSSGVSLQYFFTIKALIQITAIIFANFLKKIMHKGKYNKELISSLKTILSCARLPFLNTSFISWWYKI